MTRKPPGKTRPGSGAADEGYELWDIIKSRIEPLKRGRDRVHPASAADPTASPAPGLAARKAEQHKATQRPQAVPPSPPPSIRPAPQPPPARNFEIERKKARRLSGGKAPIDAVLDLHGMRQDEARAALMRFLHQARARKLKFVKIITGKGAAARTMGRDRSWGDPEPGVLRRQVPLWLADAGLRDIVVGFSTAGPRHGGSGALYVELRRREPRPD